MKTFCSSRNCVLS